MLGIIAGPSTAVAKVSVGQLVCDDVSDKIRWSAAERALQHHRPSRSIWPRQSHRNMNDSEPRLIVAHPEIPIAQQILAYLFGQPHHHAGHMRVQKRVE